MLILNRKGGPFYESCVPFFKIGQQDENCEVIKEFVRNIHFEVSTCLKFLANACSFLLAFLQS